MYSKYLKISSINLYAIKIVSAVHLVTSCNTNMFCKKRIPIIFAYLLFKEKMNSTNCRYSTRQVNLKVINHFRYCLPDGNTIIFCASFKYVFLYKKEILIRYHTAGSDTIFVQIYMDAPPGVSKNQIFFFTNKTVEFLR